MSFFDELKRRYVTRVAGYYVVTAWVLTEVSGSLEEALGLPSWVDGVTVALVLLGFPVALVLAWIYDLTPTGVVRTSDVSSSDVDLDPATESQGIKWLLGESVRRNVWRIAILYSVAATTIVILSRIFERVIQLPNWFSDAATVILILGLPLVIAFAWFFERTPDGLARSRHVRPETSVTRHTARRIDRGVMVAAVLAAAAFAVDHFLPTVQLRSSTASSNKIVAVLPFVNRSQNPADAMFADGVHDELLTQLSKIESLEVISRTSVERYRGTEKPIPEIAQELGAGVILEGAVQRAGDRVRINGQLIDGADDTHLWAETYDMELTTDNLFEVQGKITRVIAAALAATLTEAEIGTLDAAPTQSVAAYDAFIKGKTLSLFENAGEDEYQAAIVAFNEALQIDPNFAAAHVAKARVLLALYWYYALDDSLRDDAFNALSAAERLQPESTELLTIWGYYHYWGFLDYPTAINYFDRALQAASHNAEAWLGKAFVARRDGRYEDAVNAFEQAHRLDPLKYEIAAERADTYSVLGQFERADEMIERARAINLTSFQTHWIEANRWNFAGDPEAAWAAISHPVEDADSDFYHLRFITALNTGDAGKIQVALSSWPESERRPAHFAEVYEISRVVALRFGEEHEQAKEVLDAIVDRLSKAERPYPAGWAPSSLYYPVEVPGLLGEADTVHGLVAAYEKNSQKDAWAQIEIYLAIATAFARVGDQDAATRYLGKLDAFPWLEDLVQMRPDLRPLLARASPQPVIATQ